MNKICTSLEQSKKLIELGIDVKTADMCHKCIGDESYDTIMRPYSEYYEKYKSLIISKDFNAIPCWSLTALHDILPDEITDNSDVYRNMFFHLKGKYIIQYPRLTTLWPSLLSVEADNPVDACVDMIEKLYELKIKYTKYLNIFL